MENIIKAILFEDLRTRWEEGQNVLFAHQKTRQFIEVDLEGFLLSDDERLLIAFERVVDGYHHHENPEVMEKVSENTYKFKIPTIVHSTPGEWKVQFFIASGYDNGQFDSCVPTDVLRFSEYEGLLDDGLMYATVLHNVQNGESKFSLTQLGYGAQALGEGAVVFGGRRYDVENADETDLPNTSYGCQTFLANVGNTAWHDWETIFGKDNTAYQLNNFTAGGCNQTGATKEEFEAVYGVDGKEECGRTWEKSYSLSATFGEWNKNRGRSGFVSAILNDVSVDSKYYFVAGYQCVLQHAEGEFVVGNKNASRNSSFNLLSGASNKVESSSKNLISGEGHRITNSSTCIMSGLQCIITNAQYSGVFGRKCEVSTHHSFAFGNESKVFAPNSVAFNWSFVDLTDNSIDGYCFSSGYGSRTQHSYAATFGQFTLSGRHFGLYAGKFNKADPYNVFEMGNGTSAQRSNAFEVTFDGIARAFGTPKDDFDLVRLKDLQAAALGIISTETLVKKTELAGILSAYQKTVNWKSEVFQKLYPIGSYYIQFYGMPEPANVIGGTWLKDETMGGRFIVGASSNDTKYVLGATGGEEEVLLTIDNMPRHQHPIGSGANETYGVEADGFTLQRGYTGADEYIKVLDQEFTASYAGGDVPHENRPPYIVVQYWQRIA